MADFVQTLITTLEVGSLYALIALGYTMVYGILKFINFAHSDIVVLGAWISFTLASWILPAIGLDPHNPATPPPLWVGGVILVAAMIACGFVGFVIERLAYRPLRNAPRLNVLITAIGVSLLLQNVGQLDFVFGPSPQKMPALLAELERALSSRSPSGGGTHVISIGLVDVILFVTAAVLMLALEYLVFRTKLGTAMRAVSYSPTTAALMGIPVDRVVSFTFVLGSALAAAAGFLYAMKYPGLNQPAHTIWVLLGLKAFVAAVIGGIGNVRGAVRRRLRDRVRRAVRRVLHLVELSRRVRVRVVDHHSAGAARRAAWARRCGRRFDGEEQSEQPLAPRKPARYAGGRMRMRFGSASGPYLIGIALSAALYFTLPAAHRPVLFADRDRRRHRHDPGGVAQHRQRHDRAVFDRPRGVHGAGRLHGRHDHVLRLAAVVGHGGAARRLAWRRRLAVRRGLHRRRAWSRRRPATSSACRRCGCAATTWRS